MPKYIKSHSNYRLSKRHQLTDDGTILERDISTIGGISPFSDSQTTIYSSGNFVMSINNTVTPSRHIIKDNWLSNDDNGTIWNNDVLVNQTSDYKGSVESNIVLNNDFMDLRTFAYYGSLHGLVEKAVSHIVDIYPYEIYTGYGNGKVKNFTLKTNVSGNEVDYTGNIKSTSQSISSEIDFAVAEDLQAAKYPKATNKILYEVSNPGFIDIHSSYLEDSIALRTFSNEGYKNYSLIFDNDGNCPEDGYDFTWSVQLNNLEKVCPEAGDLYATITLTASNNRKVKLYAYYNDNLTISYLVEEKDLFIRIRPKAVLGFYESFLDECDMFEKTLMGFYSGIKNVANFEILQENGDGQVTKKQISYQFPTGLGDYNLANDTPAFENYVIELSSIALGYDEMYTDNMYRMMTHESLKNLDWTNDFHDEENNSSEDFKQSGSKFKSIIRIMGYVFDNEKAYIDNIANVNTITYNNRNNIPDYFLTDSLECDGWDLRNIATYTLFETSKKNGEKIKPVKWSEINQQNNIYHRHFIEDNNEIITPYAFSNGAFYLACADGNETLVNIDGYSGQTHVLVNNTLLPVLKDYTSQDEYSVPDINNAFMKRLRINSKQLLRKKGTVQGVESILALFGLKSKSWVESLDTPRNDNKFHQKFTINLEHKLPYDFDVIEYTAFAPPIREKWDGVNNMYKTDFYNSCKTISYPTESYIQGRYIPYQGLPVSYRDLIDTWIAEETISGVTSQYVTQDVNDTKLLKDKDGLLVPERRLYPSFSTNGIYDGGMYYQMNGGWTNYFPYYYDSHENLVVNYNGNAYKETLRNVLQMGDLKSLLEQDASNLQEGTVFYVDYLGDEYAVIEGRAYQMSQMIIDGETHRYFTASIKSGMVNIGENLYGDYLSVSDPTVPNGLVDYYLPGCDDKQIKIFYTGNISEPFIIEGYTGVEYYLVTQENATQLEVSATSTTEGALVRHTGTTTPLYMSVFIDGAYDGKNTNASHYFILHDPYNAYYLENEIWEQLYTTDSRYLALTSIIDYTSGNNPHSGGIGYDGGYEYMSRFSQLFKYAFNNEYFNTQCFPDVSKAYEEISETGFTNLTSDVEENKNYMNYLHPDKKVHSFVDKISTNGTIQPYNLDDSHGISNKDDYDFVKNILEADGVTDQILNTKVMDIKFFLKSENFYSKECQEELKYLQNKVMPYVEQMIPSNTILRVKAFVYPFNWIFDGDDVYDKNTWHDYFYWTDEGKWELASN